jgi:uncharacterized membrane protein HdeD (DUF308 family)
LYRRICSIDVQRLIENTVPDSVKFSCGRRIVSMTLTKRVYWGMVLTGAILSIVGTIGLVFDFITLGDVLLLIISIAVVGTGITQILIAGREKAKNEVQSAKT